MLREINLWKVIFLRRWIGSNPNPNVLFARRAQRLHFISEHLRSSFEAREGICTPKVVQNISFFLCKSQ